MPATTVYLLLGSNLGDRERNLGAARDRLAHIPGIELIDASAIYISEADGMEGENPAFLNQVVKAEYAYRAQELLDELEKIERLLGRTDKGGKLPRPIDLDILLFGDAVIATDRLTVPHRELLHRGFVM
ncbi:MAG TPA: 2-amino-4-hydroxy-6-hydroxymethyldihydropteridine diphosphokinase, partial [candidate division Zixibacteria bacterium]|nr:2-amino-4-hydroxy-6-hydroxymethyldihydropteridine diphosphokinase [candidate division Zixibacteria bacterium]